MTSVTPDGAADDSNKPEESAAKDLLNEKAQILAVAFAIKDVHLQSRFSTVAGPTSLYRCAPRSFTCLQRGGPSQKLAEERHTAAMSLPGTPKPHNLSAVACTLYQHLKPWQFLQTGTSAQHVSHMHPVQTLSRTGAKEGDDVSDIASNDEYTPTTHINATRGNVTM